MLLRPVRKADPASAGTTTSATHTAPDDEAPPLLFLRSQHGVTAISLHETVAAVPDPTSGTSSPESAPGPAPEDLGSMLRSLLL